MRSDRIHAPGFVGARRGGAAAHIGRHRKADNTTVGDCTHWCSPGPLEAYTLPTLQAYLARLKPSSSKERGARTRGPWGR